jgi:hypothetical protein
MESDILMELQVSKRFVFALGADRLCRPPYAMTGSLHLRKRTLIRGGTMCLKSFSLIFGGKIGLEGGFNTYAYVEGNPISYFDPDGLQQMPTSGRFPGLSPRTNASFCATAECAAGIPQGRARLPDSLRPTEGLQCTARAGVGPLGVTASWNSSGEVTYLGLGPQLGVSVSITGAGMTVGSDANGLTLRGSASFGNGAFGVSAAGNASFGGSNASISRGIGTIGGSAGITIGVSRP